MAVTTFTQTQRIGAAALCAAGIGGFLFFVTPEHELSPPRPMTTPVLAPGITVGHAAPAAPAVRRREDACGGAEQPITQRPRPLTPPAGWFNSDDYPMTALMLGKSGVTTTDLVIDARGEVIGCGVTLSSGHFSLDSRTCSVFRQRAHFQPAEDARGCPVPSVWYQRVRWIIPPT